MKKTTLLLALTTFVCKPLTTIPQLQLARALQLRGTFLAALALCFAAGLAATHGAPPRLQPLVHPGKWPALPRGGVEAQDVKVVGSYAYVALGSAGLAVIDVRDPANCVQVGGYVTAGYAQGVAVWGNYYAYMADGTLGLQVIDVSNPTNCVRVGGYVTGGRAHGVAVAGNYAYLADSDAGLQVIDVRNPTDCVRVGGYLTGGYAHGVAVSGNYAYVVEIGMISGKGFR